MTNKTHKYKVNGKNSRITNKKYGGHYIARIKPEFHHFTPYHYIPFYPPAEVQHNVGYFKDKLKVQSHIFSNLFRFKFKSRLEEIYRTNKELILQVGEKVILMLFLVYRNVLKSVLIDGTDTTIENEKTVYNGCKTLINYGFKDFFRIIELQDNTGCVIVSIDSYHYPLNEFDTFNVVDNNNNTIFLSKMKYDDIKQYTSIIQGFPCSDIINPDKDLAYKFKYYINYNINNTKMGESIPFIEFNCKIPTSEMFNDTEKIYNTALIFRDIVNYNLSGFMIDSSLYKDNSKRTISDIAMVVEYSISIPAIINIINNREVNNRIIKDIINFIISNKISNNIDASKQYVNSNKNNIDEEYNNDVKNTTTFNNFNKLFKINKKVVKIDKIFQQSINYNNSYHIGLLTMFLNTVSDDELDNLNYYITVTDFLKNNK